MAGIIWTHSNNQKQIGKEKLLKHLNHAHVRHEGAARNQKGPETRGGNLGKGSGKEALQSAGKSGFERSRASGRLAGDRCFRAPDAARRKCPRRQGAARAWAFVSSTRRQRPGGGNL